jgi:DNA-binding SARP family transcriptional activator
MEIRLLGELELVRDGRALSLPASKRTRALLGFLAATGQPHLREKLCELFWEGPNDPRAALRWSLAKLRPLVGDRLQADRERVVLLGESDLTSVRRLDFASASSVELRDAALRFRGELLDGLDLPDCFRYQAWCTAEREAMRTLRLALYDSLVQKDAPEPALGWARTRLAVDPLSEAAHAQVVRCLERLGRGREALRHAEEARRMLTEELGGHLGGELERARQECLRAPIAETPAALPPEAHGAPLPATPAESPLVGRAAELAQLQEWTAVTAAGGPHGVGLLVGEPGIGKSRLLGELAVAMRAAGGRVFLGRAFEAEMLRPYGAWIDALKILDAAEIPTGLALLGSESTDRERLFDGTARLLASLARAGRPLLLVLDDVQWLDESSAALLHYAARALSDSRVLIACAARPGELADNRAVLQTVRALAKGGRLRRLDLGPLSGEAIHDLVGGVDVQRVMAASGGNPLYALEVASALRAGLPEGTLDHLLRERLDQVEGRARDLLPFAAALGHSLEPALLAATANLPAADLVAAADELERRGILRVATGGGWDFSHDLIRDAAYRSLSEPRRRLVHLQIAQALAELPDPDGARASQRAHHATLGGEYEAAARAWLQAGERCLRVFAQAEGEKAATRGLSLVEKLPHAQRAELEMPLYSVLLEARSGAACRDQVARISRAIVVAEAANRADRVQVGFYLLSYVGFRLQDFELAHQSILRSSEVARDTDPETSARAMASTARCLVLIERDIPRALKLAAEVEELARAHQLKLHEVPWALGMVHHYTGDLARASDEHQQALRLNQITQDQIAGCICLSELAAIELERRCFPEARAWAARAVELVDKIGEGSEGPFAAAIDALARYGAGEADKDTVERSLAVLFDIDAKALFSYSCNTLAELEWERGRPEEAAAAARRALEAAKVVERKSELALALALLCRIARASGDRKEAARFVEALQPLIDDGAVLSARARRHVSAVFAEGEKEWRS